MWKSCQNGHIYKEYSFMEWAPVQLPIRTTFLAKLIRIAARFLNVFWGTYWINEVAPTIWTMFMLITFIVGREPWSRGYGRWLMFRRSWVQIPVLHTGWTWIFFILICCKKCVVCLERPTINEKRQGMAHFFKKKTFIVVTILGDEQPR